MNWHNWAGVIPLEYCKYQNLLQKQNQQISNYSHLAFSIHGAVTIYARYVNTFAEDSELLSFGNVETDRQDKTSSVFTTHCSSLEVTKLHLRQSSPICHLSRSRGVVALKTSYFAAFHIKILPRDKTNYSHSTTYPSTIITLIRGSMLIEGQNRYTVISHLSSLLDS